MRPFLSLVNASFRLGEEVVFEHTTWTFGLRDHWAIVGPNGSGKSLLADALRGTLPLVGGELQYHFRPPPGLTPEQAIVQVSFGERKAEVHGAVVQSRWNSLEEEEALKVSQFLSYERVMDINPFEVTDRHDAAKRAFERRCRRAIRLFRIESFLDRSLISLSNGETQRVRLARALTHPVRLLILDEPFAGLDRSNLASFHRLLDHLMTTSLRVLLITTQLDDLPRRITHVLRLKRCQVIAAGPRADLLPRSRDRLAPDRTANRSTRGPLTSPAPVPHNPPAGHRKNKSGAAQELVRLRHVTVRYGERIILRDLNWTIRAGESWALLGPNGSGKTTLLSLILGDHPQAYGNDIVVFGKPRGSGVSIWELKRQIGWISPELQLHFDGDATCFEVVASGFHDTMGLFERPTPRQSSIARRWLSQFGLLSLAPAPLAAVSAGLQRMVLLARALVKNPRLLILDEPCQGLDIAHRRLFIRTVETLLRSRSVTAVFVTHRPDEIPKPIHRVLRLSAPEQAGR